MRCSGGEKRLNNSHETKASGGSEDEPVTIEGFLNWRSRPSGMADDQSSDADIAKKWLQRKRSKQRRKDREQNKEREDEDEDYLTKLTTG